MAINIHMGIMCERCSKVHFIGTSRVIQFSREGEGVYRFNCQPSCGRTQEFQKHDLLPYRVTDAVFQRGCADEGEYRMVSSTWRNIQEQLAKSQAA